MRIIDLALKDLLQIVRDKQSAFFLVIMPVVFTFFFGWMFGNVGGEDDPRLPVGLVDEDETGTLSLNLQNLLESSEAIRPVLLAGDEADEVAEAVADEDWAAAVIIPAGFSSDLLAGEQPRLTVIVDENSLAGQTAVNAIQAANLRLIGAVLTAQISADAFAAQEGFAGDAARQTYVDEAVALAGEEWQQPPFTVQVERGRATDEGEAFEFTAYGQASPGTMVQFAIVGLITSAMVLVLERKNKTLQRLLTTSMNRAEIIAGHVLAMFVVVVLQQAILIGLGQLAFGVDYMRQPLAILLMVAAMALWAACLGLFISAISKTEEQVIIWSIAGMMLLGALGGAMFPLDIAGEAFAAIGRVTPTFWAMNGFQNIIVRGLGLDSVLLPAGLLLAYAAVFFGLAVWRFKFE